MRFGDVLASVNGSDRRWTCSVLTRALLIFYATTHSILALRCFCSYIRNWLDVKMIGEVVFKIVLQDGWYAGRSSTSSNGGYEVVS